MFPKPKSTLDILLAYSVFEMTLSNTMICINGGSHTKMSLFQENCRLIEPEPLVVNVKHKKYNVQVCSTYIMYVDYYKNSFY